MDTSQFHFPFWLMSNHTWLFFIGYTLTMELTKRFAWLKKAKGASLDEINRVAIETEEA